MLCGALCFDARLEYAGIYYTLLSSKQRAFLEINQCDVQVHIRKQFVKIFSTFL